MLNRQGAAGMRRRKNLRPLLWALAAAGLAHLPHLAAAQPAAVTEIFCPEKAEPLLRVQHGYGVDRPPTFVCWYKAPSDAPAALREIPESLEVKGQCRLKDSGEIADMRSSDTGKLSAGYQTCRGDRYRCAVICRP
jgi:hypothetical protein